MVECGLIRKRKEGDGYYDFYRDRIMIPIRDRFRNIIGWTARDMSEVDGTPKYLNSCQSDIYDKSDSIFGIDNAIRQAAKEEKFYCVEGAPDVMRLQSIGINNTIASLGAAWTKKQFYQIKKVCHFPLLPSGRGHHQTRRTIRYRNSSRHQVRPTGYGVRFLRIRKGDSLW